jgi:hypothetical protein
MRVRRTKPLPVDSGCCSIVPEAPQDLSFNLGLIWQVDVLGVLTGTCWS